MPFKTKEKEQEWRKENSEYLRKKRKEWQRKNPHYSRDWRRKNKGKGLYYAYTEEEKDIIMNMRLNGFTYKEIAKRLNRTPSGVQRKLSVMGIKVKKNWEKEEIETLKREYKNGKTHKELAKILNKTVSAIEYQVSNLGIGSKVGSKELSAKFSRRNKKLWNDPNHIFNQAEYRERLTKHHKNPNHIVNSEEYRQALSDRMTRNKIGLKYRNKKSGFVNYYGGYRKDLGHYVRSRWEANIARYLKFLIKNNKIKKYEYEKDCFEFKKIKRGNRSYTPDFKITNNDGSIEYWEVKGYMDAQSKTKLKRMKKYYPDIKIILIQKKEYKEIEKWSRLILEWE
jgi:hypothetical protein